MYSEILADLRLKDFAATAAGQRVLRSLMTRVALRIRASRILKPFHEDLRQQGPDANQIIQAWLTWKMRLRPRPQDPPGEVRSLWTEDGSAVLRWGESALVEQCREILKTAPVHGLAKPDLGAALPPISEHRVADFIRKKQAIEEWYEGGADPELFPHGLGPRFDAILKECIEATLLIMATNAGIAYPRFLQAIRETPNSRELFSPCTLDALKKRVAYLRSKLGPDIVLSRRVSKRKASRRDREK